MLKQTQLNTGWRFSCKRWLTSGELGFSKLEWLPASVPGHVHLDLVHNGIIQDPFVERAELGCQWVDDEDWSYELDFEFAPNAERPQRVLLFEGLDTVCKIFLNGQLLAKRDNMFVPLELDVSRSLRSGTNTLRVEFESATRVGNQRRESYFSKEGLPLETERFDERSFVRKADYMFGWDWGPRLVSAGIWRPVRLLEFSQRLLDVWVEQKHSANAVTLTCHSSSVGDGKVVHLLKAPGEQQEIALSDDTPFSPSHPQLWWPNRMGKPALYTLTSLLLPESAALPELGVPIAQPSKLLEHALDRKVMRIGLRTVELVQENDEQGQSFELAINGKRLWSVGANWIPDHSFPSVVTAERERSQLLRAAEMNMNLIRIWGGGIYESDSFYEACDEFGLLVWQDFPYACNYAPDDEAAQAAVKLEAESNVRRLRNHPSLALWCGNNENQTMRDKGWGRRENHPPRFHGERIWKGTLPQVLEQLDPTRPYLVSSPDGGEHANDDNVGDQHNWDVWHGRGDWLHYEESRGRFVSEFGFAAGPGYRAMQTAYRPGTTLSELDVRDPIARWHDKTAKGYETFIGYVELHYPKANTLEEWLYLSQLNQRDALRFGIEHYRRSDFCKGSAIWQLNDCWPAQSWAVLDGTGEFKAAAYELCRLYAPSLVSIAFSPSPYTQANKTHAQIWVVHDNSPDPINTTLSVDLLEVSTGNALLHQEQPISLSTGERKQVMSIPLEGFDFTKVVLRARFANSETLRFLCEPKDLALSPPTLSASLTEDALELESDVPAFDLLLWSPELTLRDNFVSIPQAGKRRVRVERSSRTTSSDGRPLPPLCARSLLGLHPVQWETEGQDK